MLERGIEKVEAIDKVVSSMKLNGFKRDKEHGLYIEGRQVKAAIKESSNICWPKRSWGPTKKGTKGYWSEHVFVIEDRLYLGTTQPTGINQRFVATYRGTGIQYEEYIEEARVEFTIITDADNKTITDDDWAELWVCGEQQGVGASRGVGYGRYTVVSWDQIKPGKNR